MNILVTLPKNLVEKIISGEKKVEVRKCFPKNMKLYSDGFFVVEKGTDNIRCWCRVDDIAYTFADLYSASWLAERACVSEEYIEKYANGGKLFLWKIGKVITFDSLKRDELHVDKNPQQFAYCPLSYGESF